MLPLGGSLHSEAPSWLWVDSPVMMDTFWWCIRNVPTVRPMDTQVPHMLIAPPCADNLAALKQAF